MTTPDDGLQDEDLINIMEEVDRRHDDSDED